MNATENTSRSITVRVLKYDGTEYRRWNARLTRYEGPLIELDAQFEYDVQHQLLGHITRSTRTVEYYWLDRWYNIFRFLNDDDSTRLYYCNINMPPVLEDNMLSYVDLDIDILVQPGFSYQVLDLEEFDTNARRYGYSAEHRKRAHAAVDDLVSMITNRKFPFQLESSSVAAVVNRS